MSILLKLTVWVFAFLIGASVGSFYQAAGDRVLLYFYGAFRKRPAGERWKDFFTRRSFCFGCGRPLRIIEILPVVGWFFAKGQCASCGERVTILHPLIEFGFGILSILALETIGHWWGAFLLLLILGHLLIAMMTDFYHLSLDYENTGILLVLSIGFIYFVYGPDALLSSALTGAGVLGFFLLSFAVSRGRQPGFGDILLGGVLGLLHGFPWILFPLQIGAAGSLLHIWLLKRTLRAPAPLGFYMALGSIVTLVFTLAFRT